MVNVDLLPYQMDFLLAEEEELAFIAGLGTGKSTAGSFFIINETSNYPEVPGLITASTYGQLHSATLSNLKMWCDTLGIYYKYNQQKQSVQVNDTVHFVRSAENYDASRGLEAGWLLSDEAAYMDEEAADVFSGRVRYKGGSFKKRYLSTPNGLNYIYHRFDPNGESFDPSRRMIKARTADNYLLLAQQPNYESLHRSMYGSQKAAQELDAEFVSFAGSRVYSDFDQKKNVVTVPMPTIQDQIYVVCDYNVSPFTGVCCYQRAGLVYVFDEIYLDNADVRFFSQEVKKRQYHMPIVMGDGTGNNRRNIGNLRDTAYRIFAEEGLRTVQFTNPHVSKRIANVNRLFMHNRLIVDPKCKKLINDLNLVKYKTGSNDLDKTTNKLLTHISDALGYACWHFQPWIEMQQKSKSYAY